MNILDRKIITVKEYARLTEDREVLKNQYRGREKAANLRAGKVKEELDAAKKAHKLQVEKLKDQHESSNRDWVNSFARLTEEVSALKKRKNDYLATRDLEISLESRERVLKAKEAAFANVEKQLADTVKRVEDAREEGVKKGYADGIADGLREATKITAEDRKMMAQIAALAAASHVPGAAEEIAKGVLKEVTNALPATTNKR